ncbi:von Willebrand factor A domain-containing protein 5A-like [Poecilia formosa]|uniref:von Willebrand factor A domain-containing protein 5A-like n=1 Tax=Poecilia formosa TaxID=48698 RepID=UPI0007B9052B|nr:PREDICTED: von Willebrand factor A domain-containing protein 5A-like [Poecilia formosa]
MSCRSNAAEAIYYSERSAPKCVQPHKDPLLQLVSLQKASGSWMLDEDLAAVLGKTKEEVEKAKPELTFFGGCFNYGYQGTSPYTYKAGGAGKRDSDCGGSVSIGLCYPESSWAQYRNNNTVNNEVWASILALIWLHAFKMDAKEEWELLSMKAASWIKAQNAPCVSECVEAGNKLLGCSVKKEALSL